VVIHQGDVYWVDLGEPAGSGSGYRHPHVVIQNDVFNASRIRTTIVCALTSNLKRAEAPGNVLLASGEAKLPKASVVLVSQLLTIDKSQLVDYIGTLSNRRIREIVAGVYLLTEPWETD
jgi:mRNA interferase MazF